MNNPEFWRTIFQWVVYISTVLVLIGSIGLNVFTKRIEKIEKNKSDILEQQRDTAIKKNNENTEKLMNLNTFMAEVDNPIEKLFLIIDFNRSYTVEELQNFTCYLNLHKLGKTYEFKISHAMKQPGNEMRLFLSHKSVDSGKWDTDPSIMTAFHNRAEAAFIVFDLWFLLKSKPSGLTIRDLNSLFFEIVVSKSHSHIIEEFQINANDWAVYHRKCVDNPWKSYTNTWLPQTETELVGYYHTDILKREMFLQKIDFFREGAYQYQVTY